MIDEKPKRGRPSGTGAKKSDAVKKVRVALGYTQLEFSQILGCALSSLQRMERLGSLPSKGALLESFKRQAKRTGIKVEGES